MRPSVSCELKEAAKRALQTFGLDVRFYRDPLRFLAEFGICTVLDIGANEGQFASQIRKILPAAKIHSFEPLAGPFCKLLKSRREDRNFEAHPIAIGAETGEADFEMHESSTTSSMLQPTERFARIVPSTAKRTKVRVRVVTLDEWAARHDLATPMLVKMDVQGFEGHLIRGGSRTLARASVVISEVSFAGLYEGQPLFEDILDLIRPLGFRCRGMLFSLRDEHTGEILESDAIFVRSAATCDAADAPCRHELQLTLP